MSRVLCPWINAMESCVALNQNIFALKSLPYTVLIVFVIVLVIVVVSVVVFVVICIAVVIVFVIVVVFSIAVVCLSH